MSNPNGGQLARYAITRDRNAIANERPERHLMLNYVQLFDRSTCDRIWVKISSITSW